MSSMLQVSRLADEAEAVWFEDPENLDYVRQALDKVDARRSKPRYERDGRIIGYSNGGMAAGRAACRSLGPVSPVSARPTSPTSVLAVRGQRAEPLLRSCAPYRVCVTRISLSMS